MINEDGAFYKDKRVCLNEVNDQRVWHYYDHFLPGNKKAYEVLQNNKSVLDDQKEMASLDSNMGDEIRCIYKISYGIESKVEDSRICLYDFTDSLTKTHYQIKSYPKQKERKAITYPVRCENFPFYQITYFSEFPFEVEYDPNYCYEHRSKYFTGLSESVSKKKIKFDDIKLDMSMFPCIHKSRSRNLVEMDAIDLDKNIGIVKYKGETFYLSLDVFEKRTLSEYEYKNFNHKLPEEMISYYPKKEKMEKRAFIAMPKNHTVPFDTMLKYYDVYSDLKTSNTITDA